MNQRASKFSTRRQKAIIDYFIERTPVRSCAQRTNVNRNSVALYYKKLRQKLWQSLAEQSLQFSPNWASQISPEHKQKATPELLEKYQNQFWASGKFQGFLLREHGISEYLLSPVAKSCAIEFRFQNNKTSKLKLENDPIFKTTLEFETDQAAISDVEALNSAFEFFVGNFRGIEIKQSPEYLAWFLHWFGSDNQHQRKVLHAHMQLNKMAHHRF